MTGVRLTQVELVGWRRQARTQSSPSPKSLPASHQPPHSQTLPLSINGLASPQPLKPTGSEPRLRSTATSRPGNVPWKCGVSPMHLECLKADVPARLFGAARPGLSLWPILPLYHVMGSLQTAPRIRHRIPPNLLQDYRIPTVGERLSPSRASLQAEIPRL